MKQQSMFIKVASSIFLVAMLSYFCVSAFALFYIYHDHLTSNTQNIETFFAYLLSVLPVLLSLTVIFSMCTLLFATYFTSALLKPVLAMKDNIEDIQNNVPYKELSPFVSAIYSQRLLRENNEKIREEFTANVSHELKSPLTSILGYAELIETGMAKPEDTRGFAKRIYTEASRMLALVEDILHLSKLDSARDSASSPVFEPLDLHEMAKNCIDRLRINAHRSYITLSLDGESTFVNGNKQMLEELLQNLCDNAIRYNRPGGKVFITVNLNEQNIPFVSVRDNGIGIPDDMQSRIFERFYRVDKSRSKETGGTGLGLAIVKHIVLVHDAKIIVDSKLDKGTCITVTF